MVVVYNLFFHWLFLFTFPQSLSLSLLCASFLQFMVYGRLPVFIIIISSFLIKMQKCVTVLLQWRYAQREMRFLGEYKVVP